MNTGYEQGFSYNSNIQNKYFILCDISVLSGEFIFLWENYLQSFLNHL